MPAERFFIDEALKLHQDVILKDQEFHHLKHVMRIQQGEVIEAVNGAGYLAHASVSRLAKDHAILTITDLVFEAKPSINIILAQAIPRSNRLDFVLEKGTELGVSQFWLFPSFHSQRKALTEHQIERMRALTISAMKQCGRLYLPEILIKQPLLDWSEIEGTAFFGDVRPSALRLSKLWDEKNIQSPIIFFIGPESGFNEAEVAHFDQLGVKGVKLHDHILRTETAALVALSQIAFLGNSESGI